MLDIPELDELICRQLRRRDLAQCIRVNKKWHRIAIPYLWRDISGHRLMHSGEGFRTMVRDDYLREQRLQKEQENGCAVEQHIQKRPTSAISSLAEKYGPCVRKLPDPMDLMNYLRISRIAGSSQAEQEKEPTEHELLCHLYKHCPAGQVRVLRLDGYCRVSDDYFETMARFVLPRVQRLHVSIWSVFRFLEVKYLLSGCSNTLERLELCVKILNRDWKDDEEEQEQGQEIKPWVSLKELKLEWHNDHLGSKAVWTWLWRQCHHLERLELSRIDGLLQNLTEGMLAHMPNLDVITLGWNNYEEYKEEEDRISLHDADIALILSGSRKGWKGVKVNISAEFDKFAKKALEKHFSTLEELVVSENYFFTGSDLVRFLTSCPNLRILTAIDDDYYLDEMTYPHIEGEDFIDRDPSTGLLRTWKCEASLRVLRVKITGIPRPDLEENYDDKGDSGQGREIQSQVYDRLSRLTNLETLWLGHDPTYAPISYYQPNYHQDDCLEMSLESGLHKLAGLRELKELNVKLMGTRIGLEEVQWMVEHWPRLRAIYGLNGHMEEEAGAKRWLKEHHSKIRLG